MTRFRWPVAAVLFVVLAGLATGCGAEDLGLVQLDSGPVRGVNEQVDGQDVWSFKGIPYAAPPVGGLRWQPPEPVEPWESVRDCTQFGPACPQPAMLGTFYLTAGGTDEDCLYLNVWSSASSGTDKLPVMVWIHGGSLETGSGSMDLYNGGRLSAEGVVVVTINYRLGPLGFLSHPALSVGAASGVSGNYGLMDQIAALQWVRNNIVGFGGDPANVTVFGESAGAISILDLIVSPPAGGLFHRAIVQSGVLMDQGFGTKMVADRDEAEAQGQVFAARLDIDPAGDAAAQLRSKGVDEIMAAAADLTGDADEIQRILFWKPVVDGYVLPDMPTALWLSDTLPDVSLLVGSNADEADIFLPGLVVTEQRYRELVTGVFGDRADGALSLYPGGGRDGHTGALGRMLTEVGFASSARFAARQMSVSGSDVYLYEFTRAPLPVLMGAFHGVELPYVFGTLDLFSWTGVVGQTDRDLSDNIRGYWTRFAATGDPNGGTASVWPRYEEASDLHLRLGDTIEVDSGLYRDACDLADSVRQGL